MATWNNNARDKSKANRGRSFEELINMANRDYQEEGVAVIHKVPTEFLPIRGKDGKVNGCKVTQKSCVDYLGHYKGIAVAIEAKSVKGNTISFMEVQDHQAAFLDDWMSSGQGQKAYILVSFGMEHFYRIPWIYWKSGRDAWHLHRQTGEKTYRFDLDHGVWRKTKPSTASLKQEDIPGVFRVRYDYIHGWFPYLQDID